MNREVNTMGSKGNDLEIARLVVEMKSIMEKMRELVQNVLRLYGYTVILASSEEAIHFTARELEPVDMLLVDVVMPKHSGRELAHHLTQLRPSLRVLYMSGYSDDIVVRHGVSKSSVYFLPKPFNPTALVSKIREVLDTPHLPPKSQQA
jgi:DNA-binding NtrC family response regulator